MRRKGMAFAAALAMVLTGLIIIVNPIASSDLPEGSIEKSMSNTYLWLGYYSWVILEVDASVGGMTVEDHLPEFLSYVPGFFTVDGELKAPTIKNGVISYYLEESGEYDIKFKVIYDSAESYTQYGENWAYLKYHKDVVDCDSVCVTGRIYCYFHKTATLKSGEYKVGENIVWQYDLWFRNFNLGYTVENLTIKDNFGAEIEIDEDVSITPGDWGDRTIKYKGRTRKIQMWWDIGELDDTEMAKMVLIISTDLNPKGHQEYTSPGCYELNSGATVKFTNPQGIQLSANTGSLWVHIECEHT